MWFAVDRVGKRYIDFVIGTRGTETGIKLLEKIKESCKDSKIMTDHWKAYREMLVGFEHIESKAETYTVEGYNSLMRHYLARLKRKTKCYSKSLEMLYYSVLLLISKLNDELSILY